MCNESLGRHSARYGWESYVRDYVSAGYVPADRSLGLMRNGPILEGGMATLSDVTKWWTNCGINHVVTDAHQGYVFTLCGTMASGEPDEQDPKKLRMCRECRNRLPRATVVEGR